MLRCLKKSLKSVHIRKVKITHMMFLFLQIWYRPSVVSQDVKLSDKGEQSKIYNGIPDWVFEEEVFEDNKALWWSPDATKIVWGSFDDSNVNVYLLQKYGTLWPGEPVQQYPELMEVCLFFFLLFE